MPRINSGHPIPALRPEQSDHVPWADCPQGLSSSTGCLASHSSLPVALLASHPPCGSLWAAPKAPLGPRFPSGQFATLTRREKGFYCPFCRRGSQCRAQFSWTANPIACARSCARLFPPSKWAGLFPFAAYRRSAPPQLAWSILKWRCLGCFDVAWIFLQCKRPAGFHIHAGFFMRAGGPVARRRSFLFNWQVTAPNRRATRPVAERR